MRVLALIPEAYGGFGGIAVYNSDLLTALSELPLCEKITVLPRLIRQAPAPIPPKIDLREAAANNRVRYVYELARVLNQPEHYDVVLCGHVNLLPLAEVARVMMHARQILLIYGIDAWVPTGRWLCDRLARRADTVISISPFTKQRFMDWSAVDSNRVHLLPNAVHLARETSPGKPEYLEARYGLKGRKILMTLGRLHHNERQKGVNEMLDVLPALIQSDPDVHYVIAGDGDDRYRLQAKVLALGLEQRVTFAGRVSEEEKADHYRLADVFVMPGRQEGFGFVFLEAMACGTPVVASSLDGSREAVLYGSIGGLANPDDKEALKAAILQALRRPREVPKDLSFFSYPRFRGRLQAIMSGLSVEMPSAA